MYRGTWLLVSVPLLIAALSVAHPSPLPAPALPPSFDRRSAAELAGSLARLYPDRSPGSPGALGAARWYSDQLAPYGFDTQTDAFSATIPGRGRVVLRNIVAERAGRSSQSIIVVMAHRDDPGTGPGANDNASGTAALIELARGYASTGSGAAVTPQHTIVFLSTDGGAFGGLGALRFVRHSAFSPHVVAVLNLDSIASRGRPRLEIAGDEPRSPAIGLVTTAAARMLEQAHVQPGRTSALGQLIDLGFPFSLYEQAPFVGHHIPAVTVTTAGDRPPPSASDAPERLDFARLNQVGRAAQQLLGSLDAGLELAQGTSSYMYLGSRVVRGWAIELSLIAALIPFLFAAVALFARCRRRRIPLAPALRSYRSRLGFWLWVGALFELFALLGVWPGGAAGPVNPETHAAVHWPRLGIAALVVLSLVSWLVGRDRLLPRRPVSPEDQLAGYTAALLALGVVSLLVVAVNPFALVFVLPSLHAWIWLPQVRERRPEWRIAVLVAGFAGPFLLVGSFAFRFGLGLHAPWYLAELAAIGYVPIVWVVIVLAWIAGAAQLAALSVGRYAPYPSAAERPPRGPFRNTVRAVVLGFRARRRTSQLDEQEALEG